MCLGPTDGPAGRKVQRWRSSCVLQPYRSRVRQVTAVGLVLALACSSRAAKAAPAIRSVTIPPTIPTRSASTRSIRRRPAKASPSRRCTPMSALRRALPGRCPEHVKSVKSLGSFLVLSFNAASARFASADARCTAARGILAALREENAGGFVFHPYPVTPYHADYLHHLDRIEAVVGALAAVLLRQTALKVSAKGPTGRDDRPARAWRHAADGADVTSRRCRSTTCSPGQARFDGWSGPPWIKEGWFHAYRLLAPGLDAARARGASTRPMSRLIRGETRSLAEHADLERRLVGRARRRPAGALVAGYVLKEEFFNDSVSGGRREHRLRLARAASTRRSSSAPSSSRTIPGTASCILACAEPAEAAWNPVGGVHRRDGTADLVGGRRSRHDSVPGQRELDAQPRPVGGRQGGRPIRRPAGACGCASPAARQRSAANASATGRSRSAKVVYEVLASPFEDGTEMTVADLLYPYAFVYRWGADDGAAATPRAAPRARARRPARAAGRAQARAHRQDDPRHRRGLEHRRARRRCWRSISGTRRATSGRWRRWPRRGARCRGICWR